MARMEVVQVQCDRCKRVETRAKAEVDAKTEPDFSASFLGKKLVYTDLCQFCRETLQNVWTDLSEWERPVKHRFGPQVGDNEAPPLTPAPDYTPPKPHSKAGGDRS